MKKILVFAIAIAFCGSSAVATDLNVSVEGCGTSSVTLGPGCTVDYFVIGELSDSPNEGLALVGFNLDLKDAGGQTAIVMPQGDTPTTLPMANFVTPDGITNPLGYGGTIIGDTAVQCGGGPS